MDFTKTPFDNTQADSEGWGIFNDEEIQRVDETALFADDDAAVEHVIQRVKEGSLYHWEALRLHRWSTERIVLLRREAVEKLFTLCTTQAEILQHLFSLVVKDWADVEELFNGAYPACSRATWLKICKLFQTFDAKLNEQRPYDKQLMLGGAWLNSGFSADDSLGLSLWEVRPPDEENIKRKVHHEKQESLSPDGAAQA